MSARPAAPAIIPILFLLLFSLLGMVIHVSSVLETQSLAQSYVSGELWPSAVQSLGGELHGPPDDLSAASSLPIMLLVVLASFGLPLAAGAFRARRIDPAIDWQSAALHVAASLGRWSLIAGVWGWLWLVAIILFPDSLSGLAMLEPFTLAMTVAGCLHVILNPLPSPSGIPAANDSQRRHRIILAAMVVTYVVMFVAMNWGLWFSLRLPHGDSAMYEEHLWNLEHGKGFRSYLDQGLFLGEHIQFVHVFLIPLHLIWPSHLLLELCESVALAIAVVPLYRIAIRHTGNGRAALLLCGAYLCWFGVHYLDIAIDLKTFRPIAFGIPLMLWWLDCLETRRWKTSIVVLLFLLSCKEDYAIVTAPVGLWLALTAWRSPNIPQRRFQMIFGFAHAVLMTVYLLLVVKVFIPYFRHGETVHYARYFSEMGETPQEIILFMLQHPVKTAGIFITPGSILYTLYLLVPLAFLPLRSPGRFLTALPLFLTLCLNELIKQTPGPFHHFHAPLIPILFWSAAAGLGTEWPRLTQFWTTFKGVLFGHGSSPASATSLAGLALACSLVTGLIFSYSPASLQFWDSGRAFYWQKLYVPDERATQFAKIEPLIPQTARVASTDFVHPRFTHCERSYDYSDYPRAVANYEDKVPDDTDFIVLDTRHPYSRIRSLHDPANPIRELIREPDSWEVLPDETDGYFIVLKRQSP